jgi:DNA processing protein
MDDKKYWIAFGQNLKIGFQNISLLLKYFGDLEKAWQKGTISGFQKAGLKRELALELAKMRDEISPDEEVKKLEEQNISTILYKEKEYPFRLKEIYSPPALLYIRGKFTKADEFSLGVVGTRRFSDYGKQACQEITYGLARAGLTIVSGLAVGIDTQAHKSALEAGGRTIAVLGGGIDDNSIFPGVNRKLAKKIAEQGAVVSEYPPSTASLKQNFPARNRIISGLSLGTLVVEAGEKSGALITARDALEQNREVFAVPGGIYSKTSVGSNNLIKLGAKTVTSYEDILEELNLETVKDFVENREIIPESDEEAKILKYLSKEPIHIDLLIQRTKMDAKVVSSTITLMEIKGKIKHLGSMNYIIGR